MSLSSQAWATFRRRLRPGQHRVRRVPLTLLLAGFIVAAAMCIPLIYLVIRALEVSPAGWLSTIQQRTVVLLARTLLLGVSVTFVSLLVALPLAWLTTLTDLPFRRFWSVVVLLPLVIPSYVGAFALVAAVGPGGLVQQWLGLQRSFTPYGYLGATITLSLFAFPYIVLSVRSALLDLDPSLQEAARSLGDSPLQVLWRIVTPQLLPAMLSGCLLVMLYVLSDFGAVSILRYTTFARAIYLQYNASFDRSLAAVLAIVLVVINFVIVYWETRIRARSRRFVRPGAAHRRRMVPLGKWKFVAVTYCALISFVGLVLPVGVITYWLGRGIAFGEPISIAVGPIWHSVVASSFAAIAALFAALPVAVLVARFPVLISRWIERISYAGYALPGIVIALALVFFGAGYVPFLYQTLLMLVFAYVVRFLPQAIGTVRSAMLEVSPRLEEAARGLGSGDLAVMLRIVLPMIRPGMIGGAALVFLTSMKELPATLLLAPIGYDTLATRIWHATQEAFYARAAAPALFLIAVSALTLALMLRYDTTG